MFNYEGSYSRMEKEFITKMAKIERQDADACSQCTGEDCACCEIYQDRMLWDDYGLVFDDVDFIEEPDEWYVGEEE